MAKGQRGVDLASAFVTIVPSLKGAQRQIQSQLAGVDLTPAGSELGKQLSGSIGKSMDLKTIGAKFKDVGGRIEGVGRKLTNSITKPAAVAAGAVGGLVAGLGFKRLVGLDRAEAQFKGLGYEVEKVMEQVDKGVTNTALSMADGAALAVGALATGNLPLKDLEDQIKRVANVSAAYGVEAEHAGYLLNNVLVKNKVTWGDLAQMQQNQIPIVSMLADHYGVAGDEIMKMAQDGKISIEDLNEVLDKNAGAAAEEYAKSWDGIRANIVANIGRIGAAFLEGVFPQAKEEMELFLEKLRSPEWTERARELGEKVAAGFERVREKIRELIDAWYDLDEETRTWITRLGIALVAAGPFLIGVGKIAGVVGSLATALGTVVGWLGSGGLIGAISRVLGPIGLIAGALYHAYQNSDDFRDAVDRLWDALKEAWETIWPSLKPVLEQLWELLLLIIPLVADLAANFIEVLLPKIEEFADKAVPVLEKVGDALGWLVDALDTDEWEEKWGKMGATAANWTDEIGEGLSLFALAARGDFRGMWQYIEEDANERLPRIRDRIDQWSDKLERRIEATRNWWEEKWSEISEIVQTKAEEIRSGAEEKFDELVEFVRSVPGRILAFFSRAWEWLKQAGRDILQGLQDGLEEKWGEITGWFTNITNQIPSWKGPASVDRVLLRDSGRLIMAGFIDGLESKSGDVERSLGRFTKGVVSSVRRGFGVAAPSRVGRDAVGAQVVAGLVDGLGDMGEVLSASQDLVNAVEEVFAGLDLSDQGEGMAASLAAGFEEGYRDFVAAASAPDVSGARAASVGSGGGGVVADARFSDSALREMFDVMFSATSRGMAARDRLSRLGVVREGVGGGV